MKHLAGGLRRAGRNGAGPVHAISDDRMADREEVDANLVRPPGLERDGDEAGAAQPLEDSIAGHGAASRFPAPGDAAAPEPGVANEVRVEDAGLGRAPGDDRQVLAFDV
ncbi:MAG: hypothetical protein M3R34_09215, partial [Acidobacteriota bacterium]|nr:hypothetical protein [Acidobacteriota bacterium]